MFLKILR